MENIGVLSEEEKNELRTAIKSVEAKVRVRHKNSVESELNSALYNLQDFLECVTVEDDNALFIP